MPLTTDHRPLTIDYVRQNKIPRRHYRRVVQIFEEAQALLADADDCDVVDRERAAHFGVGFINVCAVYLHVVLGCQDIRLSGCQHSQTP